VIEKLTYRRKLSVVIVAAFLIALSSCYNARVEVYKIPANTPEDANIYITGNFNNWDPGDRKYILHKHNDSTYFVDLPVGVGSLEYKFTRGDWTTVEKDQCGYETGNRVLFYNDEKQVFIDTIPSWSDLDPVD